MSNHDGSYLLNEVIWLLRENNVFNPMEKRQIQQLLIDITNLAKDKYDCNTGEILEDHADFFKLCQYCLKGVNEIKDGGCLSCRERLGFEG